MEKKVVKLGFAPTRRDIFSKADAIEYKNRIIKKLEQSGIDFIGLEWLNSEGLLFDARDVGKVVKKFQEEQVDAVFTPHCNFGTEEAVAKLGKSLNKPLLLWGPRDEAPLADGSRLRDSQCGLFATSKVLKRFGVPFTYMENCRIDDPVFASGVKDFIAAAAVVKSFKSMRIGQIDTRPESFLSVMCSEGELLEKFGIEVIPVTLIEIADKMNLLLKKDDERVMSAIEDYKARINFAGNQQDFFSKTAALKYAIKDWAEEKSLSAVAIQCWDALQSITGIMPCFADSELTDEGLPIVCETDICGAVTAAAVQAAVQQQTPVFFADLTIRHPENNNAELLWHCGPFPYSLKKDGANAKIGEHYVLESKCPGVAEWEIKGGDITICRFDGCSGKYSFLLAEGKGVDGPRCRGTYVWVEFRDWPSLERKIIEGPYIHHVVGVHGKIIPVMTEAFKYLPGIAPDIME